MHAEMSSHGRMYYLGPPLFGVAYAMASHNLEPEEIASGLEQLEATNALVPDSTEVRRLKAAEQLLGLVMGRPLSV